MSTTPPLNPNTFRFPFDLTDQPQSVRQAHVYAFNGILDLQNAITALNTKVEAVKSGGSTTVTTSTGGGTVIINGSNFPGLGGVNPQTGVTAYTVQTTDNGILLVLGDSSAVTVTLNSALTTPYFFFATNFGSSNVTLTPTSGTINQPTLDVGGLYMIVFNGTNWENTALISGGGVTQLLAGFGIALAPSGGTGVVTVSTDTHSESLTDGNANFIFAATLTTGGDIISVVGVPN